MEITKNEILKYLEENMSKFKNEYFIIKFGLFGSYARGDANETSDVDLVYILKEGENISYVQLYKLEKQFEEYFNKKIDLVNYRYMNPIIKYKSSNDIIYV